MNLPGKFTQTCFTDLPDAMPETDVRRTQIMAALIASFEHPLVERISWWIRPGVVGAYLFFREPVPNVIAMVPYQGLDIMRWANFLTSQLDAHEWSSRVDGAGFQTDGLTKRLMVLWRWPK